MMTLLRILLVLLWIPAQWLGVMMGALGWQSGDGGSTVLGFLGLIAPAVLMAGGLYLSWRRPDLGAKVLAIPIALLALELAMILIYAWQQGRR